MHWLVLMVSWVGSFLSLDLCSLTSWISSPRVILFLEVSILGKGLTAKKNQREPITSNTPLLSYNNESKCDQLILHNPFFFY